MMQILQKQSLYPRYAYTLLFSNLVSIIFRRDDYVVIRRGDTHNDVTSIIIF